MESPPGVAILAILEKWRTRFARSLACSSPISTTREISFVVHSLILRIQALVFLEARGFLEPGTIARCLQDEDPAESLGRVFLQYGLKFPDILPGPNGKNPVGAAAETGALPAIGKKSLESILPDIPACMEFFKNGSNLSLFAAQYDLFLERDVFRQGGSVVEILESPYRESPLPPVPDSLVEYLACSLVGNTLAGKTPRELSGLRILDPLCGSGRFLLAAYWILVQYYEEWYREHLVPAFESGATGIPSFPEGCLQTDGEPGHAPVEKTGDGWTLTTPERKRICETHVYGLDGDIRAADAANVILYLEILECGPVSDDDPQYEKTLCQVQTGNFLYGPDIFQIPEIIFVPEWSRAEMNVFDYPTLFPEISRAGGFGIILGNFTRGRLLKGAGPSLYLQTHYEVYHGENDSSPYSVERALSFLQEGGKLGCILPNSWTRAGYSGNFREYILQFRIDEIGIDLSGDFKETYALPGYLILAKTSSGESFIVRDMRASRSGIDSSGIVSSSHEFPSDTLGKDGWNLEDPRRKSILTKVRSIGKPLEETIRGTVFFGDARDRDGNPLQGEPFGRYGVIPWETSSGENPVPDSSGQGIPDSKSPVRAGRILLDPEFPRVQATLDYSRDPVPAPIIILPSKNIVLLAMLNSQIFSYYLRAIRGAERGVPAGNYSWEEIRRVPIPILDWEDPLSGDQYEKLRFYVGRMLDLKGKLRDSSEGAGIDLHSREFRMTDREIDTIIGDIFGLTEKERRHILDCEE